MVSLSYSDIQNVLSPSSDLSATTIEYLTDLSIDILNLFGAANISNMTGTVGSKTVTLTSSQRGAVQLVVRILYYSFQRDITVSTDVGDAKLTVTDILANPVMVQIIQKIADRLTDEIPMFIHTDDIE